MEFISGLNPNQEQAVTYPNGNLLVLAGAGSGKTRVLIHRIAWLIKHSNQSPHSFLAVTFTNKAAGEMKERLHSLLGIHPSGMWVGTFHSLAHRLLRLHYKEANLQQNFQILDADDQLRLIKRIFKELNIDEERWEPKKALNYISRQKEAGVRAARVRTHSSFEMVMSEVYTKYESITKADSLVDFSELLLASYELLINNHDLLTHYRTRFSNILVDEFQDTNDIQYKWLMLFAKSAHTLTMVGDDDQSIYGWRGAKVENIQKIESDLTNTTVIRLEQNYRSTGNILSAANAVINHNSSRLGKTLWTNGSNGDNISIYTAMHEDDEAFYVTREIQKWHSSAEGNYSDIAILYRSNAQSRIIEDTLVRAGIPYIIYGGLKFFERAEIKDALAYLRLLVNTGDNAAFERIVNIPPRGIGAKSLEKIRNIAIEQQVNLWQASNIAVETSAITAKAQNGLKDFIEIILTISEHIASATLPEILTKVITETGLLTFFQEQKSEKSQYKAENLEELVNASEDFTPDEEVKAEANSPMLLLAEFLAYVSLTTDKENLGDSPKVQMMTMHSAKGLEFPLVFMVGLEEGLFPSHFSKDNPKQLEEERRLCYVGITRAMRKLHMTHAERRRVFGREEPRISSRFIGEIPEDLVEHTGVSLKVNYYKNKHKNFVSHTHNKSDYKKGSYSEKLSGFSIGQKVIHKKFGIGVITDYEGNDSNARLNVEFNKYGSKWLIANIANLEILD